MDIAEISQIVSGLCLQTREDGKPRLDPGAVNTLALAAPYDELVKGAQEGLPPASLIQKAGLETYRTALMAAGEIGAGEDVGPYLDLLNHTSALYTVGTQYLKLANKMVRGEDVTPAQLNTLSARLADNRAFEFQYGDEVEAEAAIWEPTGWNAWDQGFGGVPKYGLFLIGGPPGCLTGDTIIQVNRARNGFKIRLDDLVARFNGGNAGGRVWNPAIPTLVRSRYEDGTIRLNQLAQAVYSGKKEVFRLLLSDGKEITGTWDHPILTPDGWVKLTELQPGQAVYVDGGHYTIGRTQKQYYPYKEGLHYHPYAGKRQSNRWAVPVHRLVVEAQANEMSFDALVNACRTDPYAPEYLRFLDPHKYAVHHIDGCARHNDPGNLQVLTHAHHRKLHADHWGDNVMYHTTTVSVVSVEPRGVQDTYDLALAGEPRNFIANGIVVHNTGKSSAAVKLIDSMTRTGKTVGMISLEMTSAVYKMRWLEINPNLKARQAHRLLISDVSYNLDEACEAITRLVDRVPDIHAIFIDFADLLVVLESTENSSQIYVKLAALAKKLVVKIFLITQLSRNYVGGIPHATDIRWSGLAEATASLILMVYNPDQLFVDQGRGSDKNKLAYIEGMAYIIEAKSRFGYYNGGTGAEMIQWGRETGWGEEGEGWTPLHG